MGIEGLVFVLLVWNSCGRDGVGKMGEMRACVWESLTMGNGLVSRVSAYCLVLLSAWLKNNVSILCIACVQGIK